jgi:hypothetical protein
VRSVSAVQPAAFRTGINGTRDNGLGSNKNTLRFARSEFPDATAPKVKLAITRCGRQPRNAVVPAVLDAEAANRVMAF